MSLPLKIILISCGALILIFLLVFILLKISKSKNKNNESNYDDDIIFAVGGKDNITEVNVISSRLSITLKDPSLIKQEIIEKLSQDGIGVLKTSKKITFVIGDLANKTKDKIENKIK